MTLVLGRKNNEKIIIYDGEEKIIEMTVFSNSHTKLAFEAAPNIRIHRDNMKSNKTEGKS